jgi:glycosyltransferase involved in cell wall biosynthesis
MTTIKYPISVIVPLSEERKNFFYNFTLPLIKANGPNEIIVIDGKGSAPNKRNDGFKKSTQPTVFFCDDDILLPANYLARLVEALNNNLDKGYAYSGYHGIVMHPDKHQMKGNFEIKSQKFDAAALKKDNYISTMSLIRREVFPGFDESLERLQDWDLFLTMLGNGVEGVYVPEKFYAFYLDEGITGNEISYETAKETVKKKHRL